MIEKVISTVTSACAYIAAGKVIDPAVKIISKNYGIASKLGAKCIGYSTKIAIATGVGFVMKNSYEFAKTTIKSCLKVISDSKKSDNEEKEVKKDDKSDIYSKKNASDFAFSNDYYRKAFENWKKEINDDENHNNVEED